MGPKVQAAVRFIESGGRRAVIGDLGRAPEALDGATGTAIVGGVPPPRWRHTPACRCASSSTTCGASATGSIVSSPSSGTSSPTCWLLNETGGRLALRRCAKALGMQAARDPWSPFRRRVKNAVLVRPPWRIVERRLHRFADVRKALYPRGALVASVGRAGRRLRVYAIHLGLHPLERLHAAEELADLTRGRDGPVLIGGDCNETPDGRAMTFLGERFWDVAARWRTARRSRRPSPPPASTSCSCPRR